MRIARQWMSGRIAVIFAAVGLLLLQTATAGIAIGLSSSQANAGLSGLVCSTGKASDAGKGDSQDQVSHHSGACCILHAQAAIEPDPAPSAFQGFVTPATIGLKIAADAIRVAPELASRSARAPPSRLA